jgi:hypothetical protein
MDENESELPKVEEVAPLRENTKSADIVLEAMGDAPWA